VLFRSALTTHLLKMLTSHLCFTLLLTISFVQSQQATHPVLPVKRCDAASARPRKEWRALSSAEQQTLLNAVLALQRPQNGGPSIYDRLVETHGKNSDRLHGGAVFLPWHRYFLTQYELQLQKVNPSIMLPYWNWPMDSQRPEASPIWESFGSNGANGCVTDGPFKDWKPAFREPNAQLGNCLVREWNDSELKRDTIGAFDAPESINAILSQSNDFDTMAKFVEGRPHAIVHNNIGGDMMSMFSPNDPIFYMHHGMIDKLWADWQALKPEYQNSYGGLNPGGATQASPQDAIPLYQGARVQDVFDTRTGLCYYYDSTSAEAVKVETPPTTVKTDGNQPPPTTPAPNSNKDPSIQAPVVVPVDKEVRMQPKPEGASTVTDSDEGDLMRIRNPSAIPPKWIERNGLKEDAIRQIEITLTNVTVSVNKISGYASPASLYNNYQILANLIKKKGKREYYADVNGTRITVTSSAPNPLQAVANIKARVKLSVKSGDVQRPIDQIAPKLVMCIGPPASHVNSANNPFRPRKKADHGFGRGDHAKYDWMRRAENNGLKNRMQRVNMADINKQRQRGAQKQERNQQYRAQHGGGGGHGGGRGPVAHGPQQHGTPQRGPQQHGPPPRGPVAHGPQQHGTPQRGPPQGGPQQHGPPPRGPVAHGPQQHGPPQGGPQQHGPPPRGPVAHGPQQHGTPQRGPPQGGPQQHGPPPRGPVAHAPQQHAPQGGRGGGRHR